MIIIYCFIIRNLLWNSFIMHQLIIVIIIKYIESRLFDYHNIFHHFKYDTNLE